MMLKVMACATLLPAASAAPPLITGYQTATDVRQHSYIDLDQKELEVFLNVKKDGSRDPDYAKAGAIYRTGGNSGATATLTVPALAANIAKGTEVIQGAAKGNLKTAAAAGATSIIVSYTSTCKVGGTAEPDASGCFTTGGAISGSVGVPTAVQNKYRTLAGFSTAAESKMQGQEYYAAFHAYYKKGDYGHQLVEDGLGKTGECATCDAVGRVEFAKKGTAYLNVWMYVIREMEDAVIDCSKNCETGDCNDDPVNAWDEAVAFYSGSLEGAAGDAGGKLLYRFALKRCKNFGTCGASGQGVNTEIMEQFKLGKTKLQEKKCSEVIAIKRRIVQLMSVPMVQGSLRYAYKVGVVKGEQVSKEKAEGFIFTAGILPLVAVCDAKAASTIDQNMKYTADSKSWTDVKAAFESTYACLGVTCAQVNGLVQGGDCADEGGTYCKDADPCSDAAPTAAPTAAPSPPAAAQGTPWLEIGGAVLATALITSLVFIFVKPCQPAQSNQQELATA